MKVSTMLWACAFGTALILTVSSTQSVAMTLGAVQQDKPAQTALIKIATQAEINAAKAEWKRLADDARRIKQTGNKAAIDEAIRKRNEASDYLQYLQNGGNATQSRQNSTPAQQQQAPQQQTQQQPAQQQQQQQTQTNNTTTTNTTNLSVTQAKAEWKRLADDARRLKNSGASKAAIDAAIARRDAAREVLRQVENGGTVNTTQAANNAQQQNNNFSNSMNDLTDRVTGQSGGNNTPDPAPQSPVFTGGGNLSTPCSKYNLAWRDQYGTFGDWNANVPTNLLRYGKAPDGSNAIVHQIRAGQIQHGDFKTRHLNGAKAACLSYKMWLPGNFTNVGPAGWHVSKLPGLYGGPANTAQGCQPPASAAATGSWSARMMFAYPGIKPYVYVYSLNRHGGTVGNYRNGRICGDNSTRSKANPDFPRNRWVQIDQEVIINSSGRADGVVRTWFDGRPLGTVSGAELVSRGKNTGVDGIFFNVWFGGSAGDPRNKAQGNHTWYYKDFALCRQ